MSGERKILRRSEDRIIAGVCGGIAEHIGWTPNRVRLAYVVLSILSVAFPGTLVYLILWIAMPDSAASRREGLDLDRHREP